MQDTPLRCTQNTVHAFTIKVSPFAFFHSVITALDSSSTYEQITNYNVKRSIRRNLQGYFNLQYIYSHYVQSTRRIEPTFVPFIFPKPILKLSQRKSTKGGNHHTFPVFWSGVKIDCLKFKVLFKALNCIYLPFYFNVPFSNLYSSIRTLQLDNANVQPLTTCILVFQFGRIFASAYSVSPCLYRNRKSHELCCSKSKRKLHTKFPNREFLASLSEQNCVSSFLNRLELTLVVVLCFNSTFIYKIIQVWNFPIRSSRIAILSIVLV